MMLTNEEKAEIKAEVFRDLIEIEDDVTHRAGSYGYLCLVAGVPIFTHRPVGGVIRTVAHLGT
jgi:hypothetical protein